MRVLSIERLLLGLISLKQMHTLRYRVELHVPQHAVDVRLSPDYPVDTAG